MAEVTAPKSPALPAVPASLAGPDGAPQFGLYAGGLPAAGFEGLRGEWSPSFLERKVIEKKWQYVLVTTHEMMLCLAIVDTGYLASGFCGVFDRGARRLLANENPVLPSISARINDRPGDGLSARLIGPGVNAHFKRSGSEISIRADWGAAEVDLKLDASRAPAPMTAIAPVGPAGRFDLTQKLALIPADGEVRAGNIRFPVRDQLAATDFTHGYLARDTAWRWAFGQGKAGGRFVAFNFSEGFLQGDGENVVWIDGEPQPAGKIGFVFDGAAPSAQWRIRSEDGRTDLVFRPEGHRAQTIDLKLIVSKYVQPFGIFSGRLAGAEIDAIPGVTEDHVARW